MTPNHRALTDAQATVDVLHGLIERVGNLGVQTIEDLGEFARRVSPQRRAKRTWAADLPDRPGVYLFVAEHDQQRHILYVGKSKNIRTRVRTYFTAAEKRPRMDEMVRVATGVEAVPCVTQLQADVIELRLIASHAPRYNRRSKFPERTQWIKITEEAFPRLSVVRAVRDDGATYFGPFHRRQAAEDVVLAIYDGFPIRQCTPRLSPTIMINACALAGMGRCCAPCDGTISRDAYADVVERVRAALSVDARPAVLGVQSRLTPAGPRAALRRGGHHPPAARDADPDERALPPGPQPGRLPGDRRRTQGRSELGDPRHPVRAAGRIRRRDAAGRAAGRGSRAARIGRDGAETAGSVAGGRYRGDRTHRRLARAPRRPADRHHRRLGLAPACRPRPRQAGRVRPRRPGSTLIRVITAIVFIKAEVARIPEVAEAIAELAGVSEVYSVTGAIDLIAMIRVAGHDQVAEVVADQLNKVPGILSTETHIAFRAYSAHDLEAAFSLGG